MKHVGNIEVHHNGEGILLKVNMPGNFDFDELEGHGYGMSDALEDLLEHVLDSEPAALVFMKGAA